MQIRTITAGAREDDLGQAAAAALQARARLIDAGYTVQTLRLAISTAGSNRCADFPTIARGIEQQALEAGFDYVSLGQVSTDRLPQIAEAIASTEVVSASAQIAGRDGLTDPVALQAAAEAIVAIAAATPNGLGNLRFAALACVGPGSPFFPAAYHDSGAPWIAIGPEAAALAIEAAQYSQEEHHADPYARLTALIEQHDAAITAALTGIEAGFGVYVAGCDWSLAPRPDPDCSIGAAIEMLSGVPFGGWGTLAVVRSLTNAIRKARVNLLGFSGVMLPVLEDAILAQRSLEQHYTLRDLLAFSAVCGTGLDTIPLLGDTSASQLARVLAEVAALAGAHRKPLTARLMPLPGHQAGDTAHFELPPELARYFCEARVLQV